MKLYEDVPPSICGEFVKDLKEFKIKQKTFSFFLDKNRQIQSIKYIPERWNLVVIKKFNRETEGMLHIEFGKKREGIMTSFVVFSEIFPMFKMKNDNLFFLNGRICYILICSKNFEEIKTILKSSFFYKNEWITDLHDKITPEMNYFLHKTKIHKKKAIKENLRKSIHETIKKEGLSYFSELSKLDQRILEENVSDNNYNSNITANKHYVHIFQMFWLLLLKNKGNYPGLENLLKGKNEMTFKFFFYLSRSLSISEHKHKEEIHSFVGEPIYIYCKNSIRNILFEYHRKRIIPSSKYFLFSFGIIMNKTKYQNIKDFFGNVDLCQYMFPKKQLE
jgi:hypothetical protein